MSELKANKIQLAKIKGIVKSGLIDDKASLDFRTGELASGESTANPNVWTVRKVSDFLYASDFIKEMCQKYNIPFNDFDVIIGPIEQKLGRGTQGGFMDKKNFEKGKLKWPYKIEKGVFMSPPIILINSVNHPSYPEQADVLIHEYRHYIFGVQNPNHEQKYSQPKKGSGKDYEHWFNYFTDTNEIEATKSGIEFELELGKSYDEIIRNKVGGVVGVENYPIARKFSEIVQMAVEEIERKT
jgi:hypothetical protein